MSDREFGILQRISQIALVTLCIFKAPFFIAHAGEVEIASTSYVKGAVEVIVGALREKTDSKDLAPVAFSGDYQDLANRPEDNFHHSIYEIKSNSLSGASPGDSFSVELDGFIFRATKRPGNTHWSVRIVNNSNETRSIGTNLMHLWSTGLSGLQAVMRQSLTMAPGAEHNPDVEVGDIGIGTQDTVITYMFDHTNMRLYRWIVSVNLGRAVMTVGRLH